MSEVVAPQAPQVQEQTPQAPAAPPAELDMSDEAIIARAMEKAPPPDRDPNTGRFLPKQTEASAQAKPAEAPVEKPAAEEAAAQEAPVNWDEVKDVKIKVPMKDGEKQWEEELTLDELRTGRMLHADYTKKTQEVAERERAAEARAQQAVAQERGQYLEALGTLRNTIQAVSLPELQGVDWNKLAAENPGEYVRLSNRARQFNEAMQSIRLEEEKVQAQQSKDRQAAKDQAIAESQKKLKEAIPTWNDDLYRSLLKRGIDTYGFKPDEIGEVWDHRIMRVLNDAHQWQALQEGKPLAEKKVQQVPNVLRPGNVKPKVDKRVQEFQQAKERLKANGNDRDAAEALMGQFLK